MKSSRTLLVLLTLGIAAVSMPARASTLLSVSGPIFSNSGIGLAPLQQAAAVSFTTANALNGVDLTALGGGSVPLTVDAYLTNSLGPGTTAANVVASNTFVSALGDHQPETAFANLDLGPGTYYMLLVALGESNLTGWDLTYSPTVTAVPGLSYGTSYVSPDIADAGGFPPASADFFTSAQTGGATLLFSISPTAAVPEPASAVLLASGLLLCLRKRME